MASKEKEDLNDFLSKVDKIEEIVKNLKYGSENEVSSAMKEADSMIKEAKGKIDAGNDADDDDLPKTKTGFSKTVINTSPWKEPVKDLGSPAAGVDPNDQGAFMAALEADANERAERRKQRQKEANAIKEKGNEEFKVGNYEKAFELYTQAINTCKDMAILYTNRAQTCIKLEKYEEALKDCDWALRCFPNCLKAYIHMGRAHLMLKQFDQARKDFQAALACDPKKDSMIKEYLKEVDRGETTHQQEAKAKELFDSGNDHAKGIVELLDKVNRKEQLPLYYSGGFRLICSKLQSTDDKTVFRSHGGMDLVNSHYTFSKCLSASPRSLSQEELDMLTSGIEMLAMACTENEANQQHLLKIESLPDKIMRFMEVKIKGQGRLMKSACVTLLHRLTLSDVGRGMVISVFNLSRLLALLFTLIRSNDNVAITAGTILNNVALNSKFKVQIREKLDADLLPSLETLLKDACDNQVCVLPSCINTVTNLTGDTVIRSKVMERKDLWKSLIDLLAKQVETLTAPYSIELTEAMLGLLSNMTFTSSLNLREFSVPLCKHCQNFCRNFKHYKLIVSRSLTLLSHILPNSIPAVDWFCDNMGTEVFLTHLKKAESEEDVKTSLKGLAACTQINDHARIFIVDHKGLGTLVRLLNSGDEHLQGNAALCLSHCTQVPKVCAALTKTDIIKDLLILARDGKRPVLQQNCAILIAKLAQGDQRHLDRLRELHGIDILHTCMKHIKS